MLITEAPFSTAWAIASPEASQVISPSEPGTVGIGTLSARAPGQTPMMPIPFCGAAATDIVAVPWEFVTGGAGERGDDRIPGPLRVRDVGGGVDERDQRALRHHRRRRQLRRGDGRAPVVRRGGERVVRDGLQALEHELACA